MYKKILFIFIFLTFNACGNNNNAKNNCSGNNYEKWTDIGKWLWNF